VTAEPQELAETVSSWLTYKSRTGLGGLLTEAALALPIGEYLSTKYKGEVEAEKDHPLFRNSSRGRPRQVDFVRRRHGRGSWHAAYECKFDNFSLSAVVNDLLRLACLVQAPGLGALTRYFVAAGKDHNDGRLPLTGVNSGKGRRITALEGILSDNIGEVEGKATIRIQNLPDPQRKVFREFTSAYGVKIPSIIITQLVGWCVTPGFLCGVWKVKAANGSVLLSDKEIPA